MHIQQILLLRQTLDLGTKCLIRFVAIFFRFPYGISIYGHINYFHKVLTSVFHGTSLREIHISRLIKKHALQNSWEVAAFL